MTEINYIAHRKYLQKTLTLNNLPQLLKQASFVFFYVILKIMVLHWKGKDSNSWFWYQVPKVKFYELKRFKDTGFLIGIIFSEIYEYSVIPSYFVWQVWYCILNSNKEEYIWFGYDINITASFNLKWKRMMRGP